MTDDQLRDKLASQLRADPRVDDADVVVSVREGVAVLTGSVPSLAQMQAARDIVARVKGVRAIAQELAVRPHLQPAADAELGQRAAHVLDWCAALPRGTIQVEVTQGVVTLSGEVEWDYQRRVAEEQIGHLAGVLEIRNLLVLGEHPRVTDLAARLEKAVSRSEIDGRALSVGVHDGAVVLAGVVRRLADGDLVERLAWSIPGVRSVDNRLRVDPSPPEGTAD